MNWGDFWFGFIACCVIWAFASCLKWSGEEDE